MGLFRLSHTNFGSHQIPRRRYKILILILFVFAVSIFFRKISFYTSFSGEKYVLSRLKGKHVELLVPFFKYKDLRLNKLVNTLDEAVEIYRELTGKEQVGPQRIRIAVVHQTCGSGCGELGGEKIEINNQRFRKLYLELKNNDRFDHLRSC